MYKCVNHIHIPIPHWNTNLINSQTGSHNKLKFTFNIPNRNLRGTWNTRIVHIHVHGKLVYRELTKNNDTTYIHVCMFVYMYVHVCMYVCMHMYIVCMYMNIFVCMCICNVCMYVCTCVCNYVHVCTMYIVCTCVCMYIHMYTCM